MNVAEGVSIAGEEEALPRAEAGAGKGRSGGFPAVRCAEPESRYRTFCQECHGRPNPRTRERSGPWGLDMGTLQTLVLFPDPAFFL